MMVYHNRFIFKKIKISAAFLFFKNIDFDTDTDMDLD